MIYWFVSERMFKIRRSFECPCQAIKYFNDHKDLVELIIHKENVWDEVEEEEEVKAVRKCIKDRLPKDCTT